MTRSARPLLALAAVALVHAACGGGAPGPTAPPPAPPAAGPPVAASASASAPLPAPSPPPPAPADGGRSACEQGDVRACDTLSELWQGRELLPETAAEAGRKDGEALKRACDERDVSSACMGYALMLKYGTATGTRDGAAAQPYWDKVKALGDLNGFRGPRTPEGAAALARTREDCAAGRARACGQLGWAAYSGVQRAESIADSFRDYARACELGSALGCRWAGHLAMTYDEVRDHARSRSMLQKGCDAGSGGACEELGALEAKGGRGDAALSLYERACAEGARSGCLAAGEALVATAGAPREKGVGLLVRACDAEEAAACGRLGELWGADAKTAPRAVEMLARGCRGKHAPSCESLGRRVKVKGKTCAIEGVKDDGVARQAISAVQAACANKKQRLCEEIARCR